MLWDIRFNPCRLILYRQLEELSLGWLALKRFAGSLTKN